MGGEAFGEVFGGAVRRVFRRGVDGGPGVAVVEMREAAVVIVVLLLGKRPENRAHPARVQGGGVVGGFDPLGRGQCGVAGKLGAVVAVLLQAVLQKQGQLRLLTLGHEGEGLGGLGRIALG